MQSTTSLELHRAHFTTRAVASDVLISSVLEFRVLSCNVLEFIIIQLPRRLYILYLGMYTLYKYKLASPRRHYHQI